MSIPTLPSFARIEIALTGKRTLLLVANRLRSLADELEFIAGSMDSEDDALILAHHRIRAISKELRG